MALFSGRISDQPFADGLGNLMQAFLASQDIYGQRQTADAKRQLLGVQTDLERQKLAREKLASDEALRKQVMEKEFFGKAAAADRQSQPNFVGPADPNLQAPSPWEAMSAGIDPEKLAKTFNLQVAMNPGSTADQLRRGLVGIGNPASNAEGVTSGEVVAAQKNELDKARLQAGATVQAAQIRGPSAAAQPRFDVKEVSDGKGGTMLVSVDPRTAQAIPIQMNGQSVGGRAVDKPPTDAQATAYSLWERGKLALEQMNKTMDAGYQPGGVDSFAQNNLPGMAARLITSDDGQMYHNSEGALINIIQRRDSGAAVTEQERQTFRSLYGVQPGDTPELMAKKRENLRATIDTIAAGAGNLVNKSRFAPPAAGQPTAPVTGAADPLGIR